MNSDNSKYKSNKNVALVTGATGFVGNHLVQKLVQNGWHVHIVIRKDSFIPDSPEFSQVTKHEHDGTVESMIRLVSDTNPTVVFHLASFFISQHESRDIDQLILSNILFGCQLLEAIKVNNVNYIINTGTSWQHYENRKYSPVNLYAATKQAFEALLQYYTEAHGLKAITLKLFDTYGTNDSRPKLMNLLKRIAEQSQILAMSPGAQYIDLVYVDDVVRAYEMAAERLMSHKVHEQEFYAVSSNEPIQLVELVKRVERELNLKFPIDWGGRAYRAREVMMPWKGDLLPGWSAQVNMAQAIQRIFSEKN